MHKSIRRLFSLGATLAAAALTFAGGARADDILEEVRRRSAVQAKELRFTAIQTVADAARVAETDPAEAARLLKQFLIRLETDQVLPAKERKDYIDTFRRYVREYEAAAGKTDRTDAERADRKGIASDRDARLKEEARKDDALKRLHQRMAELRRAGKLAEAMKVASEATKQYGYSPSISASGRTAAINDHLRAMREIRDERDRRYVLAMREVVKSSMPIIGDIEFPPADKWRELTKKRLKPKLTEAEIKLLKALNSPITAEFKSQPFRGVLDYLEKHGGISFSMDPLALELAQVRDDTPVTVNLRGVTLRSAIKKILGELGLTMVIKNEAILVTTPDRAADMLTTRTYYIGDLVATTNFRFGPVFNHLQLVQNVSALINMIQSIEPRSWVSGGGKGTIAFNPASMSISIKQTAEMHFKLLGALP